MTYQFSEDGSANNRDEEAPTTPTVGGANVYDYSPRDDYFRDDGENWARRKKKYIVGAVALTAVIVIVPTFIALSNGRGQHTTPSPTPPPTNIPTETPTRAPTTTPPTNKPTLSPTNFPTTMQRVEILDMLSQKSFDNGAALLLPTSPQSKAFEWLLDGDEIPQDENKILHRYAMATLYFANNGDGWVSQENWLGPLDVCEWEQKQQQAESNNCNEGGFLTQLRLDSNSLTGQLPPEVALLDTLSE